jgi:hypothetical protein
VIDGRLRALLEMGLQLVHERVHPCPPLFFGFRGLQPAKPFPQRDLDGSFGAFTRQTREVFNELNEAGATVSTAIATPLR